MSTPPRRRRPPLDPQVARLLRQTGLTRRSFLRALGAGGGMLAAGPLLAACGGIEGSDGDADTATAGGGGSEAAAGGTLRFSNWTLYIDVDDDTGSNPSLDQFTEETGIEVEYYEDINANDEFFARHRQQLSEGADIGRDLIVLTDWMAARLIDLGWLAEIDKGNIPNAENLVEALQSVAFDPERRFSLPWQSGLTGIGYNPALVDREITSINDLFDPALAGQVTLLTEMRDTMGLIMASMDLDPADHTFEEYEQALERLRGAVDSGQVRAFTGNDYAADLAAGNIGAAIAWSGDIIQSQFENPDIRWVLPAEGAMLWSDNMLIPSGATNKAAAEALMDFVYRPDVAAQIAAWVNFITPVRGAQEAIEEIDPELAENELIFPTDETLAQTHEFKTLTEEEEQMYQELFQEVLGA